MKKANLIVGSVVILFGIVLRFVIIPVAIEESPYGRMDEMVGPAFFPTVVSVLIIGAGIVLLISALTGHEPTTINWTLPPTVLYGIGLTISYFLFFVLLGYTISTILALAGFLWVFGERRPRTLIIVPLLVSVGFRSLFVVLFRIRFHQGILF